MDEQDIPQSLRYDRSHQAIYDEHDRLITLISPYEVSEQVALTIIDRYNRVPALEAEIVRLQTALNERDQARACTRYLVRKYEETT